MSSPNTQQIIQKQRRQSSGLYTINYASLNSSINTQNEGIIHDSYQRRLNKLKGKVLSENGKTISSSPVQGNKTSSISFSSKVKSDCQC